MKQRIDNEYIEHILERVDNTVEHSLQLRYSLYSLEWPQDAKHPQRLNGAQVLPSSRSPRIKRVIK